MNEGSDKTKAALKNAFPFLGFFKHFIYLHGKYDFSDITKQDRSIILRDLENKK